MQVRSATARRLRQRSTEAERKLWGQLRDRRFQGYKFRRQVPIDRFVVDFLCADLKLIIEVDGGQHAEQVGRDTERTRILESLGYLVVRFWNNDVLANLEGLLESVACTLQQHGLETPHPARKCAPTSPRRGEDNGF